LSKIVKRLPLSRERRCRSTIRRGSRLLPDICSRVRRSV